MQKQLLRFEVAAHHIQKEIRSKKEDQASLHIHNMEHAFQEVHRIREVGGLRSLEEELVSRGLNEAGHQIVVEQPLCVATIREARANLEREDDRLCPRSSYK